MEKNSKDYKRQNENRLLLKLGLKFKNPEIFHQAMVHRSFLNENPSQKHSNERLEFLGDAVLEFLVSHQLFEAFPQFEEGDLTALRAKLVNTKSLSSVGKKLNIGKYLYLSKGEEEGGGRENQKLLANAVEAIIGAIFIDQGIDKTKEFVSKYIFNKTQTKINLQELKDPKTLLQEIVQAKGFGAPLYRVVKEEGPDHAKRFEVAVFVNNKEIARGYGRSQKEAQQQAAKFALKTFEDLKIN